MANFSTDQGSQPSSEPMPCMPEVLAHLKTAGPTRFERLEDLTALDETARSRRPGHDATVVYTLTSLTTPGMVRLKSSLPSLDAAMAGPAVVGHTLFSTYWLAVEGVSVLLFAALAAVILLGRGPKPVGQTGGQTP